MKKLTREEKLDKLLGSNLISRVSDMPQKFTVISTGIMALDLALGIGGWPENHLSVVWGSEAGGKTTMGYCAGAAAIKMGKVPLLVDMEKKGSPKWMRKNMEQFGVDPDELLISQPETGVEALNIVLQAIGAVDIIILDSVYQLVTPGEMDSSTAADQHPAALARLLGSNIKPIVSRLHNSGTVMLWINQERRTFDRYNPVVQPGGKVMEFTPIIITRVRRKTFIPQKGLPKLGIWCEVDVKKNQADAPHRRAQFALYFDRGIDKDFDAWETAKELGVVTRAGAYYSWRAEEELGFKSVQGEETAKGTLKSIEGALDLLHLDVEQAIHARFSTPG